MIKYTKILSILIIILGLNGCILFHGYSPPFSQGNLISPEQVSELHVGMPAGQVLEIMGSPLLIDTFSDNRLDYVYTFQTHSETTIHNRLIVSITNGRVSNIVANIDPNDQIHPVIRNNKVIPIIPNHKKQLIEMTAKKKQLLVVAPRNNKISS
jgi:outer membrane protein assembly factor BamE